MYGSPMLPVDFSKLAWNWPKQFWEVQCGPEHAVLTNELIYVSIGLRTRVCNAILLSVRRSWRRTPTRAQCPALLPPLAASDPRGKVSQRALAVVALGLVCIDTEGAIS